MIALVGSNALKHYCPDIDTSNDVDLIGTYDDLSAFFKQYKNTIVAQYPLSGNKLYVRTKLGKIWESEIAWTDSTGAWFLDIIKEQGCKTVTDGSVLYVPTLDMLYALKMSHRYLKDSPHFLKTMQHILLMRKMGAKIPDYMKDWYKAREKETYHYQHPNLNRTKKEFFTPDAGIEYIYDHDSIHWAVKLHDKPAYNYYKPDENEVLTNKKMFFDLPEIFRLSGVIEETYVLALERSQIPYPTTDRKWSFDKALEKVCTSITSGWFREYAWENYNRVQSMYNPAYVEWFKEGLDKGVVKLHDKSN